MTMFYNKDFDSSYDEEGNYIGPKESLGANWPETKEGAIVSIHGTPAGEIAGDPNVIYRASDIKEFTGLHDKNGAPIHKGHRLVDNYGLTGTVMYHNEQKIWIKSMDSVGWHLITKDDKVIKSE